MKRTYQACIALAVVILAASSADAGKHRGSYAVNGELHVNVFGTPEGKPITTGHQDMKPSWSKEGNMLVFFRVIKFANAIPDWRTAICVVNTDGTGFHQLSDGTHTDFNPTWTRDGSNVAIWNRQSVVMQSRPGAKPGGEYAVSDPKRPTTPFTCLQDGRILVYARGGGGEYAYYLMTPGRDGAAKYEPLACEPHAKGYLDRVSVSPDETKVCFELQNWEGRRFVYRYPGRQICIASFDPKKPSIWDMKVVANDPIERNTTYLYPRWVKDASAIVYHSNKGGGKNQLYMYTLKGGSTKRVSTDPKADYMFPHGEATPK
jgi:Tol biopolymer transport system component